MSLQEFTRASESASIADGNMKERHQNSDSVTNNSRSQNAKTKTSIPRAENKLNFRSTEGGKLLQDTQIEERRKKLQARKAAVEERQKHKEINDSTRSEAMRQLIEQKAHSGSKATGRKLPNVPSNSTSSYTRRETSATRRLSSSSSSSDSTGHTPPGSGRNTGATRRNLTGPTSASTSSLNSFGSTQHLSIPRTNLGASKKASVSATNLNDKTLINKKTGLRVKEKGAGAPTNVGSTLPKARSMSAIHQVGHSATKGSASRPSLGKKGNPKQTHHAGTSNELEAKQALAERRKRMREEAERKALLDKEKQEELRRQREEEEKRLAEENAKEMARQAVLAEQLHKDEEERAKILQEQRKKEAAIEAEKVEAEMKRKEQMEALRKLEIERRAKEAEKREKEEQERLRQEDIERQKRRKRVEMIMSRTRMTSTVNNNMIKSETYSSLEDLSTKLSDEYHSNTVSEILQKVKEKRASPCPEKDTDQQKENERILDISRKDSVDDKNDNTNDVLRVIDNSKNTEVMSPTRN